MGVFEGAWLAAVAPFSREKSETGASSSSRARFMLADGSIACDGRHAFRHFSQASGSYGTSADLIRYVDCITVITLTLPSMSGLLRLLGSQDRHSGRRSGLNENDVVSQPHSIMLRMLLLTPPSHGERHLFLFLKKTQSCPLPLFRSDWPRSKPSEAHSTTIW